MSIKFEIFATDIDGGAVSLSASYTIEDARKGFIKLRNDPRIVQIRVREDTYNPFGGCRESKWLCDWSR